MLLAWFQGLFTSRLHGRKRHLGLCNWQSRAATNGGRGRSALERRRACQSSPAWDGNRFRGHSPGLSRGDRGRARQAVRNHVLDTHRWSSSRGGQVGGPSLRPAGRNARGRFSPRTRPSLPRFSSLSKDARELTSGRGGQNRRKGHTCLADRKTRSSPHVFEAAQSRLNRREGGGKRQTRKAKRRDGGTDWRRRKAYLPRNVGPNTRLAGGGGGGGKDAWANQRGAERRSSRGEHHCKRGSGWNQRQNQRGVGREGGKERKEERRGYLCGGQTTTTSQKGRHGVPRASESRTLGRTPTSSPQWGQAT